MALLSGHKADILTGEELSRHQDLFKGFTEGLVRLTPGRWLLETTYLKFANKIYNFKFKNDDVLIMTHPKCGTTWVQELVWTMRNNPSFDHPLANTPVNTRSPFIEGDTLCLGRTMSERSPEDPMLASFYRACPGGNPAEGVFLQMAKVASSPRVLKTHLPFSLLSPSLLDTAKVIYVVRNPKDVCVSFHHHCRLIKGYDYVGSLDQFVQRFVQDELINGPFWNHVKDAWERKNHPSLLFLYYEDLKAENLSTLSTLNDFLGTQLNKDQLEKVGKYCTFDRMRERSMGVQAAHNKSNFYNVNVIEEEGGFFRKGEVGDWKTKLSPSHEKQIDEWTQENIHHLGIPMKYGD